MNGSPILTHMPKVGKSLSSAVPRATSSPTSLWCWLSTNMLRPGDVLPARTRACERAPCERETVRGAIQTAGRAVVVEVSQGSRTRVGNVDLSHVTVTIASPKTRSTATISRTFTPQAPYRVEGWSATRPKTSTKRRCASLTAFSMRRRSAVTTLWRFSDLRTASSTWRSTGPVAIRCSPILSPDLYTYMMDYRRSAMSRPGAIEASYKDHSDIVAALRRHDRRPSLPPFTII